MNGIEILATEEVATLFKFDSNIFHIVAIIIMGACVIAGVLSSMETYDWSYLVGCTLIGLLFAIIMGVTAGMLFAEPIEYETQYKVLISDEVSMNNFNAQYEIIDQEGNIYTIRERN